MKFSHYNLGHVNGDSIIEVVLEGSAANVRLMDTNNFNSYKSGRKHHYYGGLVRKSPFHLKVPISGHWHVTVDMQGLRGTVRSNVRVIPGSALRPLPVADKIPLRNVPTLVRNALSDSSKTEDNRMFDVFISHASEDKDEVVRPLAIALQATRLTVWYDEFELRIGDNLRQKIDQGLARSRFGVVVLSQAFFKRDWPQYELDGLVTLSVSGDQILLPIWHNVSKCEVMKYSPSLANRLARSTSTHTVEEIAEEIVEVIQNPTV